MSSFEIHTMFGRFGTPVETAWRAAGTVSPDNANYTPTSAAGERNAASVFMMR